VLIENYGHNNLFIVKLSHFYLIM